MSVQCGSEERLSSDGPVGQFSSSSSASSGGCSSPAPIPVNLHVCHESRREALRRYQLLFGIAQQPGRIFFDPDQDVLYFGPRDGFMASEAQLRTVLTLCDPEELRRIRKVAINDALFWLYESSRRRRRAPYSYADAPTSPSCSNNEYTSTTTRNDYYHGERQQQQQQYWPGGFGGGGFAHMAIATSLLADTLQLLRTRLPGLQELIFVPRDENPLYSGDCCLVEPAMVQGRMIRQIREAMGVVFGDDNRRNHHHYLSSSSMGPGQLHQPTQQNLKREKGTLLSPYMNDSSHRHCDGGGGDNNTSSIPWKWKIMTLSADPDPPVYGRRVLGWEEEDEEHSSTPTSSSSQQQQQQPNRLYRQPVERKWRKRGGSAGGGGERQSPTYPTIINHKRKRDALAPGDDNFIVTAAEEEEEGERRSLSFPSSMTTKEREFEIEYVAGGR